MDPSKEGATTHTEASGWLLYYEKKMHFLKSEMFFKGTHEFNVKVKFSKR